MLRKKRQEKTTPFSVMRSQVLCWAAQYMHNNGGVSGPSGCLLSCSRCSHCFLPENIAPDYCVANALSGALNRRNRSSVYKCCISTTTVTVGPEQGCYAEHAFPGFHFPRHITRLCRLVHPCAHLFGSHNSGNNFASKLLHLRGCLMGEAHLLCC